MTNYVHRVGGETTAHAVTTGNQTSPATAALSSGGYVVVWSDDNGDGSGRSIRAQRFDSSGAKVGAELLVNSTTFSNQTIPTVVGLPSGGFAVAWSHEDATGGDGVGMSIRGRVFGASGSALGDDFLINTNASGHQMAPSLLALTDGGFVASWHGPLPDGDNVEVVAQRFNASGAKVGSEFRANSIVADGQDYPSGTGLTGGGYVLVWSHRNGAPGDNDDVRGQRFDSAGNAVGSEFLLSTDNGTGITTGRQYSPDVAALPGGGFVAVWQSFNSATSRFEARGQIFGADGARIGSEFTATNAADTASNVSVAAFSWGGFVVAWDNGGLTSPAERAQMFDSDGSRLGDQVELNLTAPGLGAGLDIAITTGDRLVGTWTSSAIDVKVGLFTAGVYGTAGHEYLSGTANDDLIFGFGGDDGIEGGAGADLIRGGDGNDEISGGSGADSIDGGTGDDFIVAGSDADSVDGGSGDDILLGEDGNDTLLGGLGNDFLRGGSGVDSYDGGEGGENSVEAFGGDRVSFFDSRATQGAVADLRTGIISNDGFGNAETMTNIESLGADTAFVDTLYGNDEQNRLWAGLGDYLYGFGDNDWLQLASAPHTADGGDGVDTLALGLDGGYRPDSNADGVAEIAPTMTAGWTVDLGAGTALDGYGNSGGVTGIENVTGTDLRDEIRGDGFANRLDGGAGNDLLILGTGGDDHALGGAGNDVLYFGKQFTAADVADGGADRDVLVLQGNYTLTLSATNMVGIESFSLQSGAQARWGDTANAYYDYDITMAEANTPAGVQLIVNAQSLRVGEDLTFDGSAESDGRFLVYAGHGVDDLTGGDGNDVFFFEGQRWGSNDVVDGGDGRDSVIISSGNGVNRFVFGEESFANIEAISVNARFVSDPTQKPSYELVLANGNVAPGATLILNGNSLSDPTQFVDFDGSAVEDGNLIMFGGAGNDTLTGGDGADLLLGAGGQDDLAGGAGADSFRYDAVSDSLQGQSDVIEDFLAGVDRVDLSRIDANSQAAGDQAFAFIGSNAFSNSAGQLRIVSLNGFQWAEGDTNGDGAADLVIGFDIGTAPLSAGDFIL